MKFCASHLLDPNCSRLLHHPALRVITTYLLTFCRQNPNMGFRVSGLLEVEYIIVENRLRKKIIISELCHRIQPATMMPG